MIQNLAKLKEQHESCYMMKYASNKISIIYILN